MEGNGPTRRTFFLVFSSILDLFSKFKIKSLLTKLLGDSAKIFAKIFAESPKSLVSRDFILNLLNRSRIDEKTRKNVRLVGPLPSIMEKKSGVYRWELSIFSKSRSNLHKFLDVMQSRLYDPKLSKQVRWSIDVDPLSSL